MVLFLSWLIYLFFTFSLCVCLFSFFFWFEHIVFFFQVTKMLSIINLDAPPFQKICENYHVTNVTIYPTSVVYCKACHSNSTIQKWNFLHSSIATNDKPMLLTIESKWLETIVHMTKSKFLVYLVQNKFNSSFQFTFMVNFHCRPHLPLLAFKKTSNNLSHKWKPIWRTKVLLLLQQLFLMIMSNVVWTQY